MTKEVNISQLFCQIKRQSIKPFDFLTQKDNISSQKQQIDAIVIVLLHKLKSERSIKDDLRGGTPRNHQHLTNCNNWGIFLSKFRVLKVKMYQKFPIFRSKLQNKSILC